MPMDAKEVESHGRNITKAQAAGEPGSSLIKLLDDLRTGVLATEDLLRSTKIGIIVNKLKTHKDPNVAKKASELVSKWRSDVKKAGADRASTPKQQNGTQSPASQAAPSPVPAAKPKPKHNVPLDKRSVDTDGVEWRLTGNTTRDNCLKMMYNALALMVEDSSKSVMNVARDVELAAYNRYQPETSAGYKERMRSLFQNLKNKSNPGLRKRVLSGEIPPAKFVVMTSEELMSAERRAEAERLEKENMNKAMVAQAEKSISTSLTCGKCGQKKVSYSQAQTRSADEPMTTFCECTVCGNRWKFS
ncbi:transcription elongation factor TFIIS [Botryosphaeria dothidea]|uniref:Transcription elongation factor n=1 Tax=Botryosphaeria dothidea TaxID=55169 RepID=A0A8H4IZ28_9PEZI|nr:Zinc finger TFIIS-type protein [Botryosphaeria dothidea]